MLILTRRPNEAIVLGRKEDKVPPIRIVILEVKGNQVRIGIEAPREIIALREEIMERDNGT